MRHPGFLRHLGTKATRGGGPPFRIFGKSAVYQWADVVAWVRETMGEAACTTAEHRAREGVAPPPGPTPAKLASMVEGARRYNADRVAARRAASSDVRPPPQAAGG